MATTQSMIWLALGYNVPVNPSKNRVYVWRKLKEYGAEYFKQGVALLPKNSANMAQFRSLSVKIREMGGDATIAELRFVDKRDEAQMVARFNRQSEIEYNELIRDCGNLVRDIRNNLFGPVEQTDYIKKMVKRYKKVRSRDYFKTRRREDVAAMLDELAGDMAYATDELVRQLAAAFKEQ